MIAFRALLLVWAIAAMAVPARASPPVSLDAELASILNASGANTTQCKPEQVKAVGLWKLNGAKLPLSESNLKRVYSTILSHLVNKSKKCLRVVDETAIGAILQHLSKSGALDDADGNVLVAIQKKHQDVDFLVHSDLYAVGSAYVLNLRLIDTKTGSILRQTKQIPVPASWVADTPSEGVLRAEQAVKEAAGALIDGSEKIAGLQIFGVFYKGTSAQPEAGRWLGSRIEGELLARLNEGRANKTIRTRGIGIVASKSGDVRVGDISEDSQAKAQNLAILTGRYWPRGNNIDLRYTLKYPSGLTRVWQGSVRLSDLKGLALEPQNQSVSGQALPDANFGFKVTTDNGPAPTYVAGDRLRLLITADRSAWLYCFYIDSEGAVQTILPLEMEGSVRNVLAPRRLLVLTGPTADMDFVIQDNTVGEELVSCFAALRDIKENLPKELFPRTLGSIPLLTLAGLRDLFRRVKNVAVAEQTVTATILKGR